MPDDPPVAWSARRRWLLAAAGLGVAAWAGVSAWGLLRWQQQRAVAAAVYRAESRRVYDIRQTLSGPDPRRLADAEFDEVLTLAVRPRQESVGLGTAVDAADTAERRARVAPLAFRLLGATDPFWRGQGAFALLQVGGPEHLPRLKELAASRHEQEQQFAALAVDVIEGRKVARRTPTGLEIRDRADPPPPGADDARP